MKALKLYPTEPADELAWPESRSEIVTLNSSALAIFTDFSRVKPHSLKETDSAVEAARLMQLSHVPIKLVLSAQGRLRGIVSLESLNEQEFVKRVASGQRREHLTVSDFMLPKHDLKAFDYTELSRSSIGNVLETLKSNYRQHCLVLDRTGHQIRGVISAADIARGLNVSVNIERESTFANIFQAVFWESGREAN